MVKNNKNVVIISLVVTLFLFSFAVFYRETFSVDTYELDTLYYVDNDNKILFVGSETSAATILENINFNENENGKIVDKDGNEITDNIYGEAILNIKNDEEEEIDYRVVVMYFYPMYDEILIDKDNYIGYVELETTAKEFLNMFDLNYEYSMGIVSHNEVIELTDTISTGDKIVINFGNGSNYSYDLSVIADISGNGVFDLNDVVNASRYLVGWTNPRTNELFKLGNVNENAIDITKNGEYDLNDVVTMNRILVGMKKYNKNLKVGEEKLGDVNLDGFVDGRDLIRLERFLSDHITFNDIQLLNANLNDDNGVNDIDLTILKRHLEKREGYDVLPYTGEVLPDDNPSTDSSLFGDVNTDGIINETDMSLLSQYLNDEISLNDDQLINADVNSDGNVDKIDSLILEKHLGGSELFNTLPYTDEIIFGDVNLDGILDGNDMVKLGRYVEKIETFNEKQLFNADLNLDGFVDKIDSLILAKHFGGSELFNVLPYTDEIIFGDVNLDGKVDENDYIILDGYLDGSNNSLTEKQLFNADVNLDSEINSTDSSILSSYLSKEEGYDKLPYLKEVAGGEE